MMQVRMCEIDSPYATEFAITTSYSGGIASILDVAVSSRIAGVPLNFGNHPPSQRKASLR